MKITEKQLMFLQDYVKRKKRFLDTETRLELVDHLVCDFEVNGNGNISKYLADKSEFIFNYKNYKSDEIHWAYQRELWKVFFSFFTNLKTIPAILLLIFFLKEVIEIFSQKTAGIFFMILIIIPMFYGLIKTYHKKKKIRSLIEFKHLANIYSLPSLFIYTLSPFKEFWFSNDILILSYMVVGLCLNFAAVNLILRKRKGILKKYSHLLQ